MAIGFTRLLERLSEHYAIKKKSQSEERVGNGVVGLVLGDDFLRRKPHVEGRQCM
jgi:hypothetical protein